MAAVCADSRARSSSTSAPRFDTIVVPMKPATKASIMLVLAVLLLSGAEPYRKPPQAVLDVLNSPLTPTLAISPTRHFAMQGQPIRYPPIAELAQPMLRIAGMRINPKTNGLHNTPFNSSLSLRKIPEGAEIKVDLPPNAKLTLGRWSPDATHFAFTNTTERGIELWLGDTTGKTRRIEGVRINAVMGGAAGGGGGRGGARPRRTPRAHRAARPGKPRRRVSRSHP